MNADMKQADLTHCFLSQPSRQTGTRVRLAHRGPINRASLNHDLTNQEVNWSN